MSSVWTHTITAVDLGAVASLLAGNREGDDAFAISEAWPAGDRAPVITVD